MQKESTIFLIDASLVWDDLGGGVERQVMGYNEHLMMVKFRFKKGGIGAPHHHIHSQSAMVVSGVFELTINDEKSILSAGDGYMVAPDVVHSVVCLEEGILVDAFSPVRHDFLR